MRVVGFGAVHLRFRVDFPPGLLASCVSAVYTTLATA